MTSDIDYRPATLADSSALAVLIDIAGEGLPAFLWRGLKAPGQSVLEFGRYRARREEGGFSYRNAIIAELDDEIAGTLIGYPLDDPYELGNLDELPELLRPMVKLEAQAPGSWYVNVLATFPEFRRRGVGEGLLAVADEKAREAGAATLSVIVGSWNQGAARLYERAGYVESARQEAHPPAEWTHRGEWVLMVKAPETAP
ncbi:putative acetyltransferase [Methyloligella halotolerans]|uniref:Putative acetyltransferase n=1 Tax=Methyloligella halotolerans TaxID=1177755 RepID=A0A1E2S265_9HYPH|nr:GNAT family N-acetyltransferase [Methyloligella halotolerans]ODA68448.1 putative acetyltransferase [Methyloligella halotolerans]